MTSSIDSAEAGYQVRVKRRQTGRKRVQTSKESVDFMQLKKKNTGSLKTAFLFTSLDF